LSRGNGKIGLRESKWLESHKYYPRQILDSSIFCPWMRIYGLIESTNYQCTQ